MQCLASLLHEGACGCLVVGMAWQDVARRTVRAWTTASLPAFPLTDVVNTMFESLLAAGLEAQYEARDSVGLGDIGDPAEHTVS